MDLFGLMNIFTTLEACKDWLRNKGILATPGVQLTCACGHHFIEIKRAGRTDESKLRCCSCKKERAIRIGSFFSGSHLSLQVLVSLLLLFAYHAPVNFVERVLNQSVSKKVIIDWFSYFRDICSRWLLAHSVKLGGPGCIVEIYECLLKGKRKYNRGRVIPPGQWVFGVWDRRLSKGIVLTIPNRQRATLLPMIKQYILPGTIIYSDGAPMYATLDQEGYHHDTVIHDVEFVAINAFGIEVHTNSIEGWWSNIKAEMKRMRGTQQHMIPQHLDEVMYRQHRQADGDIMDCLVNDIAEFYRVPTHIN